MFLKIDILCRIFIYLFVILIEYKITFKVFSQHDPTQNIIYRIKKYHFSLRQKDLSQTTDMC